MKLKVKSEEKNLIKSEIGFTRLIPLMVKAQGTPFAVPPPTMATMCKHLYQVGCPDDGDYDGGNNYDFCDIF